MERERQSSAVWRGRGRQVTNGKRLSYYANEENLREPMSQMTLQAQGKLSGYSDEPGYPHRPTQPDCGHYMRTGFCGYGINCCFNHPSTAIKQAEAERNKVELLDSAEHNECQFFLKTGTCKFGATCKYHHPHGRAGLGHTQLNMLGFPIRMGEKECTYYMHTGSCKYGASCKFDHPQPAALGTYVPVSGSSIYSTVGSPLVPSSGAQHSHSLSTWPSPQTPRVRGPHIQGQPPYIPVIYSSQQGMLSAPVWGMYQAPVGPMASERQQLRGLSIYGSAQPNYTSVGTAQGFFTPFLQGSSTVIARQPGQFLATSNLVETYPERPGEPECRYYIKTGDCKFGSACRYHHPQGRLSESLACALSPIGLPLRPTQPTCTYYHRYGICKFGPTCRFDHPMTGISYSRSSSSLYELPVVPYPRVTSPTTTHIESPLQEIRSSREQPLGESIGSKQDVGTVHSVDTAAAKASPSSHVSILSETA